MLKDLKRTGSFPVPCSVSQGDARNIELEDASVDACITSPPYLNFIDYTKLYALELSLLVSSNKDIVELRKKSMKSHVSASGGGGRSGVDGILGKVVESSRETLGVPEVVQGYLGDLYESVSEVARVLASGGKAVFVIGNAALPSVTVDADLALAEMGEKLGLKTSCIWVANVRWADVQGITKTRPVRESAVVLAKE
jgi:DNA modification methylase